MAYTNLTANNNRTAQAIFQLWMSAAIGIEIKKTKMGEMIKGDGELKNSEQNFKYKSKLN